ncbi:hypothetical protein POM88_017332 [Heracleum sosnowskyi]|uniref:Transmembrane protein n=1 Tax=Heracleum sosnowskyi TaxID=360622 RepID=A0AAD8INC4_9APIA|nr:hypothetical protein POM88_017332 [Heracleum sosnowskyi]
MVQNKKQNSSMFSQINSSNKGIQILLSLSVLAFIISQYSSLVSSYLSSFKLFSSTTTDRHYIFLLCNGLMLLVIKTSGLFSSPTPPGTEFYRDNHVIRNHAQPSQHQFADLSENIRVKNNVISHQPVEFSKKNNVELQIDDLPETQGQTNTKFVTQVEEAKSGIRLMDQGGEHMTSTTYYEQKEQVNDLNFVDEQEQGKEEEYEEEEFVNIKEEEEEEIMLWSTEELNKKCDDFIRKMKYGIRFEAPLVMV